MKWLQNLVNGLLAFATRATVQKTTAEFAAEAMAAMQVAARTAAESIDLANQLDESDAFKGRVAAILTQERVLRLLRLILEDHPVACRAEALDSASLSFCQPSTIEDLPSPAEASSRLA